MDLVIEKAFEKVAVCNLNHFDLSLVIRCGFTLLKLEESIDGNSSYDSESSTQDGH
jgi:hypothetical protein